MRLGLEFINCIQDPIFLVLVFPTVVLEFVSSDGSEERDITPFKGKFWVYEHEENYGLHPE